MNVYLYLYQEDGVIERIDPDLNNNAILIDKFWSSIYEY